MSVAEIGNGLSKFKLGTDLVRPRERLTGNWGTVGTLDAELE
jgi:hypothetical protein